MIAIPGTAGSHRRCELVVDARRGGQVAGPGGFSRCAPSARGRRRSPCTAPHGIGNRQSLWRKARVLIGEIERGRAVPLLAAISRCRHSHPAHHPRLRRLARALATRVIAMPERFRRRGVSGFALAEPQHPYTRRARFPRLARADEIALPNLSRLPERMQLRRALLVRDRDLSCRGACPSPVRERLVGPVPPRGSRCRWLRWQGGWPRPSSKCGISKSFPIEGLLGGRPARLAGRSSTFPRAPPSGASAARVPASPRSRLILNLIEADSGSIRLDGAELVGLTPAEMRHHRREMQIVFQDPLHSLNPRRTVAENVARPLLNFDEAPRRAAERVRELSTSSRLEPAHAVRNEFSGGQCQRIATAALALNPRFLFLRAVCPRRHPGTDPQSERICRRPAGTCLWRMTSSSSGSSTGDRSHHGRRRSR